MRCGLAQLRRCSLFDAGNQGAYVTLRMASQAGQSRCLIQTECVGHHQCEFDVVSRTLRGRTLEQNPAQLSSVNGTKGSQQLLWGRRIVRVLAGRHDKAEDQALLLGCHSLTLGRASRSQEGRPHAAPQWLLRSRD